MHTITVTEEVYRRLSERAARLQLTPEALIEHLLAPPSNDDDVIVPPAGSVDAVATVGRLSVLFTDMAPPDIDSALADPMIALANSDLDDLGR
jgi:hypothetical protein